MKQALGRWLSSVRFPRSRRRSIRGARIAILLVVAAAGAPAAAVDLAVSDVYFRDQPSNGGSRVSHPAEGQQLYAHFEFVVVALSPVTFAVRIELDGTTLCSSSTTTSTDILWFWCSVPWTATTGAHVLRGVLDPTNAVTETNESNNIIQRSFTVPSWDLVAVEVFFRDQPGNSGNRVDEPQEGQMLYPHFSYIVNGSSEVSGTLWTIRLDGAPWCTYTGTTSLGHWTGSCGSPLTIGDSVFTLSAELDPNGEIEETNETNNQASRRYAVPLIDLVATEVFFRDQPGNAGNRVDAPEEGQQVYAHFAYDVIAPGDLTYLLSIEIDGTVLCAGPLTTPPTSRLAWCTAPWTVTQGAHTLSGVLDPDDQIVELWETNNAAQLDFTLRPEIRVEPVEVRAEEAAEAAGPSWLRMDSIHPSTRRASPDLGRLLERAQEKGTVSVLATLDVPLVPEGLLGTAAREAQRHAIQSAQDDVLDQLAGYGAELHARYRYIPHLALRVDAEALNLLTQLPTVRSIQEDRQFFPSMASSNPVIGSPSAWAEGYTGAGQVVAVLDSGVDKTHPFFSTGGNKVVSEACYNTNDPASNLSSFCPGGVEASTDPGSGMHCDADGCAHGTHVAGTVAGNDGLGPNFGVAPDAEIIAINVFSRLSDPAACAARGRSSPCTTAQESDIISGLLRVYELGGTFNVVAANMSLGGGQYSNEASCDSAHQSLKDAIDVLRTVGVASIVASGNRDYRTSMSTPACISSAISVGATDDSDYVASFSNIASFLDLLAPGVDITSSVPGGGLASFPGTSMACPHVAGGWALLRQAYPSAGIEQTLEALRATGVSVDDQRSGGSIGDMRRIRVDQAVHVPPGARFVVHNGGNANLIVSSISLDAPAAWIDWAPQAPFDVPPGESRTVSLVIDFPAAPAGQSTRRLLVESNDTDESPYPGGVNVVVTRAPGPGEVRNLVWPLETKMIWDFEPAASEYHVYRDDLANVGPGPWGVCRDDLDLVRTDLQLDDAEKPQSGMGFAYLVTAENSAGVEGTMGFADGGERSGSTACP